MCRRIGEHGADAARRGATRADALQRGRARDRRRSAPRSRRSTSPPSAGRRVAVFADETRPLLQGSRLTAWELAQAGIDVTVLADGMAASLMRDGRVDLVIVGADRIAANGDVANKIGHLCARARRAASRHPVLRRRADGPRWIPRQPRATRSRSSIAPRDEAGAWLGADGHAGGVAVYNPAFDVTPGRARDRDHHRPRHRAAAVPLRARSGTPSSGRGRDGMPSPSPRSRRSRSPSRSTRTASALAACRRCGHAPEVVPIVSHARAPRAMLVGQAPGQVETRWRTPFAGRAGQHAVPLAGARRARRADRAGAGSTSPRSRDAIPGRIPAAAGTGCRRPAERAQCADWLDDELRIIRPALVIPVGRLAIDRFLGAAAAGRGDRPGARDRARWVVEPSRSRCRIRAAPAAGCISAGNRELCSSARSICSGDGWARPRPAQRSVA